MPGVVFFFLFFLKKGYKLSLILETLVSPKLRAL